MCGVNKSRVLLWIPSATGRQCMFGYWEWQLRHRRIELVASLKTCNSKGERVNDLMGAFLSLCLTAPSWKNRSVLSCRMIHEHFFFIYE